MAVLVSESGTRVRVADGDVERLVRAGYRLADGAPARKVPAPAVEPVAESEPVKPSKPVGEPRGNASTEAWADYASGIGVEFPEDANRKQIQEAIVAAGK